MLAEQLVNSFHFHDVELRTKIIGTNIEYSPEELKKELVSGIQGWINTDLRIETTAEIDNENNYLIINRYLSELKEITDRYNILYTEVVSSDDARIPDRSGIVHIIRII